MYENPEIAFGGTAKLLTLIELIYSAVDQPELWPAVADAIAAAAGGESTALFARFPKDSVIGLARFGSGCFEEYAEYYTNVNVWMERCDKRFPLGTVRYSHLVIENSEFESTEFYADFCRRWNMYHSFGIKVTLGQQLPEAYIACQRAKSKGPFSDSEGVVYQTLLPHLQRALRLHFKLSQAEAKACGLEGALEAFSHGVFGLDRSGRIIFFNAPAEATLRKGDAVKISEGTLVACERIQDHQLQSMISGAVATGAGFGLGAGGWMLVGAQPQLRLAVTPVRSVLPGYPRQLAALVYVSDPSAVPLSRAEALRALYRLSPTEARIADLLCAGLEVRAVSATVGMTIETTRFYVKRILAKTGTRKQTELVKMMLSIPVLNTGNLVR